MRGILYRNSRGMTEDNLRKWQSYIKMNIDFKVYGSCHENI
jgi:hypothetical protein